MSTKNNVNKNDILAIIQANRQLGEGYDIQSADQIYELIAQSQKPSEMTPEDVVRVLGQLTASERKRLLRPFVKRKHSTVGTIATVMALSIPLMGIAGASANMDGVVAVLAFDVFVIVFSLVR